MYKVWGDLRCGICWCLVGITMGWVRFKFLLGFRKGLDFYKLILDSPTDSIFNLNYKIHL